MGANKLPFREATTDSLKSHSFLLFRIKFNGPFMALPIIIQQGTLGGFSHHPKLPKMILKEESSTLTALLESPKRLLKQLTHKLHPDR